MTPGLNRTLAKRPPSLPPRCDSPAPGERLSTAYRYHLRSHPLKCPTCRADAWLPYPLIRSATMQTRLQCPQCKAKSQFTECSFRKLDVLARVLIITFTLYVFTDFFFFQKKAMWDLDSMRLILAFYAIRSCFEKRKRPYLKLTPLPSNL